MIVAPDKFKGSLTAAAAAAAMARGVQAVFPEAAVVQLPIADGGEGTVSAIVAATGARVERRRVTGPLGEPVEAAFALLPDGRTAVLEMAAASGLTLIDPARRDPRRATTYGTGELIRHALDAGCRRLVIGIGGSATNDGGAGMARALGVRFYDHAGTELPPGGAALADLSRVDVEGLDPRLAACEIQVACDVANPLIGPAGASRVFGPQKGAGPEAVAELDAALARYAAVLSAQLGRDVAGVPGAGAAGGLGAGLLAFTPAKLEPGFGLIAATIGFERHLEGAHLVLTGEGSTDAQTLAGKVCKGVAEVARARGVAVVVISGSVDDGASPLLAAGVSAMLSIVPGPMALGAALQRAAELLTNATATAMRLVRLGKERLP